MLNVRDVCVRFGRFEAVKQGELHVNEGEIVGLVGTNGAGKSSLFAAIAGQVGLYRGVIEFLGRDITHLRAFKRVKAGLGRTFQVPREFGSMTVLDNLFVAANDNMLSSMWLALIGRKVLNEREAAWGDKATDILLRVGLADKRETLASELSGGQKKLLELARALMLDPKLILLDEPFAGVNPVLIGQLSDALAGLRRDGVTLLIVEHHLQALSRLADRLYVMDDGQMIGEGSPVDVLKSEAVQAAYMGG